MNELFPKLKFTLDGKDIEITSPVESIIRERSMAAYARLEREAISAMIGTASPPQASETITLGKILAAIKEVEPMPRGIRGATYFRCNGDMLADFAARLKYNPTMEDYALGEFLYQGIRFVKNRSFPKGYAFGWTSEMAMKRGEFPVVMIRPEEGDEK